MVPRALACTGIEIVANGFGFIKWTQVKLLVSLSCLDILPRFHFRADTNGFGCIERTRDKRFTSDRRYSCINILYGNRNHTPQANLCCPPVQVQRIKTTGLGQHHAVPKKDTLVSSAAISLNKIGSFKLEDRTNGLTIMQNGNLKQNSCASFKQLPLGEDRNGA